MTHDGGPGENAGPNALIICWSIAERVNVQSRMNSGPDVDIVYRSTAVVFFLSL